MSEKPRLLVVQHQDGAGLGRLRPHLEAGADVDVRRPDLGDELPRDLHGVAGLVVLGGSAAAWEDERAPWLPHTRALMVRAVDEGTPLLAICLGAQLLAHATGGRVERGAAGIEAGLSRIVPTDHAAGDALLATLPAAGFPGPQGHQDAVVELPPGAVLLATGELYPHQVFRLGPVAWGVQYHPEVSAEDFIDWMREDEPQVRRAGLDPAAVVREVIEAGPELDALAAAHARAFLAVSGAATTGSTVGDVASAAS
jgi:GMP synthase (glutamine-hydrolysing)